MVLRVFELMLKVESVFFFADVGGDSLLPSSLLLHYFFVFHFVVAI